MFLSLEYSRGQVPGDDNVPLVLIQTGAHLGFAGGNNVDICIDQE